MRKLPKEIAHLYSRRSRNSQIEKWRASIEKGTEITYTYGTTKGKLTLENVDVAGRELLKIMREDEFKVFISYSAME